MIDKRRHERFGVRLLVRYTKAEEFVSDYVENLSAGGLFLAGANQLQMFTESDVNVELPGQGSWTVRARVVYLVDEQAAKASGRRAGAGREVLRKPPGYDDALLGYLLRLGRRRDHAVAVALGVVGGELFADAGYRVVAIGTDDPQLLAVIVPPSHHLRGDNVHVVESIEDVHDILARIDSLL